MNAYDLIAILKNVPPESEVFFDGGEFPVIDVVPDEEGPRVFLTSEEATRRCLLETELSRIDEKVRREELTEVWIAAYCAAFHDDIPIAYLEGECRMFADGAVREFELRFPAWPSRTASGHAVDKGVL